MKQSRFVKGSEGIFQFFSSLKLAVIVILGLAVALSVATILESLYDTPTAQFWVYRSAWFSSLLALLGVNILFVAISRYPWKKKHIPFLLAHVGILILLAGSWMTEKLGIDGNIRIAEGETTSVVELDHSALILIEKDQIKTVPIPWLPVGVAFTPIDLLKRKLPYDIQVVDFLTHADPIVSFVPNTHPAFAARPKGALQIKVVGGPMGISQDLWLWEGDPTWQSIQAGPARFTLGRAPAGTEKNLGMVFRTDQDGGLAYIATSSEGKVVQGKFKKGQWLGKVIQPGWKGNLTVTLVNWIPNAISSTEFKPARVQYGNQAPPSAIRVVASQTANIWLGLGDRATIHYEGREVDIAYFPKRVILPFSVKLEKFNIEHDPGTMSPASYSSQVKVVDPQMGSGNEKDELISMNEPLHWKGYTLYQASYEDGVPRPTVSIFSVNQDPGRFWKYLGSFLIVLGSIMLFAVKYRKSQASKKAQTVVLSEGLET